MAASSHSAVILVLLLLLLVVAFVPAPAAAVSPSKRPTHQPPSFPAGISTLRQLAASSSSGYATAAKPFTAQYFLQELDHFTFTPNSSRVFSQKYLLNDTFWRRKPTVGPLFVYMGGEADIEWLATTTGFMFDIAPEFGALIVFIEKFANEKT
ncbi:unnamed protein product [Triticum turgidum subsp. durum]|uniref:Uncharacterized protein n=1 Tax=Triticum turgidum subsp. durum TaxID=4567 RepID=A0A9R0ZPJ5_TRITD|nr:unnamed protein product [Triticum turgidum subsp. durum]